jgi:drug/metabolite transporter (DMT)-like permease
MSVVVRSDHSLLRPALLMTLSAVLFGTMAITIRYASAQLHPFEIAFFRSLFGALFTLPFVYRGGMEMLRTPLLGFYVVRCAVGIASMCAGFWAMVHLPLAQAVSLYYATPLFVTIGAVLVLGEVVRVRRWTAVIVGFIGVLIIVRPGTSSFSAASLIAIGAAALSGGVTISIKYLSRTEPANRIVLLTQLLWVPLSLPMALPVWLWPHGETWLWAILSGMLGTTAHMCWTRALQRADASLIAPISFVQLPVVSVLAYLCFGEKLGAGTVLGSAVIFASNVYIAQREARLARRASIEASDGELNR